MDVMTKMTQIARGVTWQELFMHEAPPDVVDGTEHPWASSNTEYGQDTHCCVRKGAGEV